MRKLTPFILLFFLISCKGDEANGNDGSGKDSTSQVTFDTYMQKVSYAIGLDHGRGCYTAYTSKEVGEAFDVTEIKKGMVDYLVGNELRVSFFAKDSLLNLYLQENGQVDDSEVSKSDASYCIGIEEAFTLVSALVGRKIDQEVDVDYMVIGIEEALDNVPDPTMQFMDARREVEKYYSKVNKENGQQFLEENILIEGVVETESGLQYEIIQEGTGISPNITDSVTIHYTGRFIDGRVFESTIPSNRPFSGSLMSVIQGWQEGVMLMKEGGQRRLYVPHELAYGKDGKGVIEPYSTLIFDIELIAVKRFQ